ncbi:hypothetical protein B0H14DRAFT_3868436 [Mycena olivaceomarginata]|nr:hypothetical protein B0H14DRAFT_3868436 [Mycena olivaceomarginata]
MNAPTAHSIHRAVSQDNATADLSFTQALNQTTPEEDTNIFVAAQRGDVATLRALLDSGHARATDRNTQNITSLHWAAINAQLPACRLLLDAGADVDALGGDLVATPLQWAAAAAISTSSSSSSHTAQIPPSPTRRGTTPSQLIWSE